MEQRGLKTGLRLLTVGCLMWAAGASAQVYVGGSLGKTDDTSNCFWSGGCDKSHSSYQLLGGYAYNQNVAIEFAYTNFGRSKSYFSSGDRSQRFESKVDAYSLAMLRSYSLTDQLSVFGKLGTAYLISNESLKAKGDGSLFTGEVNRQTRYRDLAVQIGVGLEYKLNDHLVLRAGYDQYRYKFQVGRKAFQTTTIGARYAF